MTNRMISEAVVEEAWVEAGGLSPKEATRRIQTLSRLQPFLMVFVLARGEELSPAALELANYLFFVVANMFFRSGKVRRVTSGAIEACSDEIEERMASFEGANERFLEQEALAISSRQPHVMRYVTEAIVEAPLSSDDPIPLTPDEQGMIFLILLTVIRTLEDRWAPNEGE